MKKTRKSSAAIKISKAELRWAEHEGPKVLDYYRRYGLKEGTSRAVNIAISGAIPLAGMAFLGWNALSMLAFMVADAVITLMGDFIRYPIARHQITASHRRDFTAGRMLLIVDGLEDGSGERADNGKGAGPGVILFFGFVSTLFLLPIVAAATEHTGIASFRDVIENRSFLILISVDAAWRWTSSLIKAITIRFSKPDETFLFLESGGIAVLYACLLILIWLPIKWGDPGLLAMFIIIYTVRLAFGIFAYIWTPRVVNALQRRIESGDWSVKVKPGEQPHHPPI